MIWLRPLAATLLAASVVTAAEWPQWLGPRRDGNSSEKVAAWKAGDAPKVVWRVPATMGFSSPVVAGGRVFLHTVVKGKDAEAVTAYDAATGTVIWKDEYPRPPYQSVLGVGPRATPTVAGNRLYTTGINGVLTCYEADTGKRRWQVDLYKRFQATLPRFAVCCSPLVVGDRVLVSVGGPGKCIVALSADTGETLWQALDDPASTSSPILFAGGGRPAGTTPDVVFMTPLRVVGLDPLDGTLRWEHPMVFQPAGTSPTPAVLGDLIVASTQAHGAVAVRVATREEKLTADAGWQNKDTKSYFSSGVAAGDYLYLVTNVVEGLPETSLACLDSKTGKCLWTREKVGYFHAGVIRTGDGKLLILNDGGTLSLLEVDGQGAKELCKAKVCGGTLVTPALVNGKLYARDDKELICLQVGE
jgi:outer membrane protein assembly factor BamB